jgi:hypothetical protein
MKFKKIGIYAAIISLALATLSGCNSNKDNSTDTNEVTVSPMNTDTPNESAIPPVATQDDTIVSDDDLDDDLDDDNDDLDDKVEDKLDDKLDKDDKYDAVFKDHLTTAEYKVEKDGTYEFECEPSDKKAYWNIYVLDEPFEDAFRYLANAYEPTIKATKESKKIKLKKGQYVYGVCSENSFTDEGTADNFKCPLTIELD